MDLQKMRCEIDQIDAELVKLFCRRMDICASIGAYKAEHGLPVHVPAREAEKLWQIAQLSDEKYAQYTKSLYETMFTLSKAYQNEVVK